MALLEDEDTKLNPGQADYNQKVNNIAKAESAGSFDDSVDNSSADSTREAEDNPDSGWSNNFTGQNGGPAGAKLDGRLSGLKKKGPIGTIIALIIGGGIGISSLMSPGLLLVQMKEALVDRFNTQLTSMDIRTNKVLYSKINNTTTGFCTGVVSVKCKFSSMSDEQVAKFKSAGIDVVGGDKTTITGRTKPKSFVYNGETIDAKDFSGKFNNDLKFRAAVKQAYNPKYAGFADNTWKKLEGRLGINKAKSLPEGDAAEKEKALTTQTREGFTPPNDGITCPSSGNCKAADGSELTQAESDSARAAKADAAKLSEAASSTERAAGNSIGEVAGSTASTVVSGVGNFLKVSGGADAACSVYNAVRGLGYAAKTVRAVQLARYAMVFLNTADQIKAGTATPEDVAYLGGILTNVAYDIKSGVARKAAMDSFGMKYALYGEVSQKDSYVSEFMAGGGLTGDLISITNYINNATGGSPKKACGLLANPWVQGASLVAGIGLLLVPGVNVVITAGDVAKGVLSVAGAVAMAALPSLMKDIVAGNVTKGLVGEDSSNAIASGSGTTMGKVAQLGGNGAMSVDDALAYNSAQNEVLAQYAADDRATLSPLDATNKNTFLGSIVAKLLPNISQISSLSGSLSAVGSIISSSLSSIIPTSNALSQEQLRAAYTSCSDPDYSDLGIATDPFCNPIFGIPPQYLNKDPNQVIDELTRDGSIDELGNVKPNSKYESYLNNCINRTEPLGSSGDSGAENDGAQCKIDGSNVNYYLYTIDSRINTGMDGYSTAGGSTSASASVVDPTQLHSDSSNITCDPRTTDSGIQDGYYQKNLVKIRVCQVPDLGVAVNSRISKNAADMVAVMKTSAVLSGATSGFRTMDSQTSLYNSYQAGNGNLAAVPGTSNHQMGLAIDFKMIGGTSNSQSNCVTVSGVCTINGDATYSWLKTNAASYGFTQDQSEFWHWEVK